MKLIQNKSIGTVIYVVEGFVGEAELLKEIYHKILHYRVVEYKNTNKICLYDGNNRYSRIYIIPAEHSAIKKFKPKSDYFEKIYSRLSNEYNLDVESSAVYFLFDRDKESNRPGIISKNISIYKNSRDNGYEMNGLFLLSYPCLESFYYNCNKKNIFFKNSQDAKNDLNNKNITEQKLIDGLKQLFKIFKDYEISFKLENLDDFSSINNEVFKKEEDEYQNKGYHALSLIFFSLIDLGIIDLEWKRHF